MNNIINPLTELPEAPETATQDPQERFQIDSEERANWLLKKLAAIDAERALIKAQAKKRDEELKADHDSLMGRFGEQLRAWAREEASRRKRQGVTLMYGTLAFRAQPARLVVASEPDAITTAKVVCPDAVSVEAVERFDRESFLAYATAQFEATGELLPGIDRQEAGESFSVRFAKAGKGEGGE